MLVFTAVIAVFVAWVIAAVVLALLIGGVIGHADRAHRATMRRRSQRERRPTRSR